MAGCTELFGDEDSSTPRERPESGGTRTEPTDRATDADTPVATTSPTPDGPTLPDGTVLDVARDGCVEPTFDRTLDVVEDLDCDPNGDRPCDAALQEAATNRTLLWFPSGSYRVDAPVELDDRDLVGFAGDDARLVPPRGFNGKVVDVEADQLVYAGIDVDVTAENTTASLRFICRDGFVVDSVEFVGRGSHRDPDVEFATYLAVTDPGGCGMIRGLTARRGSAVGHYKGGDGRGGVWIGSSHRGTIDIEDVDLREFGNNAIYASRCPGDVRVEGGYFENNSPSSVRISGAGSYVDGATIVADMGAYDGPMTNHQDIHTRGIVIERVGIDKRPGAEVRGCNIQFRKTIGSTPAIEVWPTGHTVTVRDTTIRMTHDGPAVRRAPAELQGSHEPADPPRWVRLEDVTIDARSTDFAAVDLTDAPESVLRRCRVQQDGPNAAVRLLRSPGSTIDAGTFSSPRYPIVATTADDESACVLAVEAPPELDGGSLDQDDVEFTVRLLEETTSSECVGSTSRFTRDGETGVSIAITDVDDGQIRGAYLSDP